MENYEKRKDAGDSYPEGAEILLKETAKGTIFANLNEFGNFKTEISG